MHNLGDAHVQLTSHSPEETRRVGALLAHILEPGDVLLLSGPMGAGKTHLTQGIGAGLGVGVPVRSPTFTLINEYHDGRLPLFHLDLYRLQGDTDLASIGLDELLDGGDGVVAIEWPEHGQGWMPDDVLVVTLASTDDETVRTITLYPQGSRSRAVAEALAQAVKAERGAL